MSDYDSEKWRRNRNNYIPVEVDKRRKWKRLTYNPLTREMTFIYRTWHNMLGRCYNPKVNRYESYGGRGITVCERWHNFDNFADDIEAEIGPHPGRGWSIDRIEGDKGYEPGNVQWLTKENNSKKRGKRLK